MALRCVQAIEGSMLPSFDVGCAAYLGLQDPGIRGIGAAHTLV